MAKKKPAKRATSRRHPLIDEFDAFLREQRPDYFVELQPGVSLREIADLEASIGSAFPPLLRDLYLWHNAASKRAEAFAIGRGDFLPLSEVGRVWLDLTRNGCEEDEPQNWCEAWIPFMQIGPSSYRCVDQHGSFTRQVGQIVEFWNAWEDRPIVAPSLEVWLQNLLDEFKSGRWSYDKDGEWNSRGKPIKIPGYPIGKYKKTDKPKFPLPEPRPIVVSEFAGEPLARQIARSPESAGLRVLNLYNKEIGPAGMRELAESAHLQHLQSLNLMSCSIGDEGVKLLADSPHLTQLRQLELGWNRITFSGISVLLQSPVLKTVRFLGLRGCGGEDALMEAVARSPYLQNLECLELMSVDPISPAGVRFVARSKTLRNLKELDLSCNDLGDDAIEELAAATGLSKLESIDLTRNKIGLRGALALVRSTKLRSLRLDLSPFQLTDADITAISRNACLTRWKSLKIYGGDWSKKQVTQKSVQALAGSRYLKQCESLEFHGINMGNAGLRLLAETRRMPSLRTLVFLCPGERLSSGFAALVNSPHRAALKTLEWKFSPLGDAALKALAKSKHIRLESLSLQGAAETTHVAEILAGSEAFCTLRSLNLSFHKLEMEHIQTLLDSPNLQGLTHLNLEYCGVTPPIAKLIAESDRIPRLTSLVVTASEVRQRGEAALRQRFGDGLNVIEP